MQEIDRVPKIVLKLMKVENKVCLEVEDNGPGMKEKVRKRIFEPFFTTKSQVFGVGLGLSTVYGIMERHNGSVDVDSQPGKGAVFTLKIPVL